LSVLICGILVPSDKGFRNSSIEHSKNNASAYCLLAVLIFGVLMPQFKGIPHRPILHAFYDFFGDVF
jgi:hypothetical protein